MSAINPLHSDTLDTFDSNDADNRRRETQFKKGNNPLSAEEKTKRSTAAVQNVFRLLAKQNLRFLHVK